MTVRLEQTADGRDWLATAGPRRIGIGPTPAAAVDALWRWGFRQPAAETAATEV